MRYYSNFIGSFFGFGKPIIAEPTMDDIAGMPEMRIRILETIANSAVLDSIMYKNDPEKAKEAANIRIKAQKIADYQKRMLKVSGYYGDVDLAAIREMEEEMAEDWWLNNK